MSGEITAETILGSWVGAGAYVSFEFRSNGRFRHVNTVQGIDGEGTWELNGKVLFLSMPNGSLQGKVKLKGSTLFLDFERVEYELEKA